MFLLLLLLYTRPKLAAFAYFKSVPGCFQAKHGMPIFGREALISGQFYFVFLRQERVVRTASTGNTRNCLLCVL